MNIVVLTQEDPFYIPRNVELLCREPGVNVREIVVLDSSGSLDNMRTRLVRWFGVGAAARMALRLATAKGVDLFHRFTGYRFMTHPTSLRAVAMKHGIPFSVERSANAPRLLDRLRGHDLDVVVSYSAPQVFKEDLLRLPKFGCINLHCSLLPRYRGLLPSFWVLFHGETTTGATVHLMDAEIDNGGILKQTEVDIRGMRRMVDVLSATKAAGGELMVEVLREIKTHGSIEIMPNQVEEGEYVTWPTDEEARQFRTKGYRLA